MVGTSIRSRYLAGLFFGLASFGALACEPIAAAPARLDNGVYCLTGDVSGGMVVSVFVLGSNTTLDCQGHRITDTSGAASYGVYVSGADNVAVENCTIDGFSGGINLGTTTNYRVVGNRFLNTRGGRTIEATGDEGLIARNTFGSPVAQYNGGWMAAYVDGTADIVGNTVVIRSEPALGASDSRSGFYAYGGGVIAYNLVQAQATPGGGGAGIYPGRSIAYRNVLVSAPGSYRIGLACYDGGGFYFENFIVGSYPYSNIDCSTNLQSD